MILQKCAYKELNGDVTIYNDFEGKSVYCKINNYLKSSIPTKRNKYITLDCYRWSLVWINTRVTTFDEYINKRLDNNY